MFLLCARLEAREIRTSETPTLTQSSVDLSRRSAAWQQSGWSRFDAASPPLAPDEIRRERELYRTGSGQ
jgi:hypothetical protein